MQTTVKERPILFSGPMVRAILEGRKTQARRIIKPQPGFGYSFSAVAHDDPEPVLAVFRDHVLVYDAFIKCPYGKPGDRLWVRETWAKASANGLLAKAIHYRADGELECYHDTAFGECEGCVPAWRPSIHMPRWASRILLEVTSVRVERLQDMTFVDWKADFVPSPDEVEKALASFTGAEFQHEHSKALWESINGSGSWEANPWVWVLELKRVESEVAP